MNALAVAFAAGVLVGVLVSFVARRERLLARRVRQAGRSIEIQFDGPQDWAFPPAPEVLSRVGQSLTREAFANDAAPYVDLPVNVREDSLVSLVTAAIGGPPVPPTFVGKLSYAIRHRRWPRVYTHTFTRSTV